MKPNKWLVALGVLIASCLVCISILFIGSIISPTSATPTIGNSNIETSIAQTAQIASTQTALLIPITATLEVIPTSTSTIAAVTFTPTETVTPTATVVIILPTIPQIAGCSCTGDLYNCTTDFSSQSQAQACFNSCVSQGVGDIHGLDGDGNGLACEDLP